MGNFKKILSCFIFSSLFFLFCRSAFAQVNGNSVGPELAEPVAQGVIAKTHFTGTAAIIVAIGDKQINNYAPGTKTIIRVTNIKAGTSIGDVQLFANTLNSANFPNGTLVVFGNELNNLDPVEWDDPHGNVKTAAADYAKKFIAFSQVVDHNKYIIAPAPPDLYNTKYSGTAWADSFGSAISGNCNLVDTLVANIFKLNGVNDWLTKYTYEENHICSGKTVSHFEGWGADPHASIKDQIDFLKNQQLPGQVQTGTTLIVNNCSGFGGNSGGTAQSAKDWLYWVPTTPDKVYSADGSEFDYATCKAGASKKTFDVSKEIPCFSSTDPEFHSLRPYPANPCDKQIDETALMCGNDLIVKKTFHVTRDQAQSCVGNVCKFNYTGVKDSVTIDLTNANLPIVGNTEDVPNGTWTTANTDGTNLSGVDRVNNYVSWYLNGIINRAEEDFPIIDPNYAYDLINLSGPINKLLPFDLGNSVKSGNVSIAQATLKGNLNDKLARHNELTGCIADAGPYNLLSPCYLLNAGVNWFEKVIFPQLSDRKRLADLSAHTPPIESQYQNLSDFSKAYLEWLGSSCSPNLPFSQFYVCVIDDFKNITTGNVWSRVFANVPLTNTEDRVGNVFTEVTLDNQLKDGAGNGGTVTNVSFTPVSNSHNLYFSHVQEDAELAKLLQGTYATKSDAGNDWEGQLKSAILSQNSAPTGPTHGCVQQETATNPGDNLYGNVDRTKPDRTKDQQISGDLKYDASFTCEFKNETDPICVSQCSQISNADAQKACLKGCVKSTCDKDIYTTLSVFTKTPKAYELSQRLVDGAMSAFKRFFPKVGPDSLLTQIKDIPAVTTVTYSSDADTKAGMTGNDGSNASLYFPHIGSLQEYFLKGIQKALRPKMCENNSSGQSQNTTSNASGTTTNGGYLVTVTPNADNLVTSQTGEYGQKTCDWASAKGLAFAINANFGKDQKNPLGPLGSAGQINNYPLVNNGVKYRSFWIDGSGNASIGDTPANTTGFKFIVTGVTFDSFNGSSHLGPEARTMLGYANGKLYMVALKAETPGSAQAKMQQIMGLSSQIDTYAKAFFLDSDQSTYICNGTTTPIISGGGTPTASMGIKTNGASSTSNSDSNSVCSSEPLAGTSSIGNFQTMQCPAFRSIIIAQTDNSCFSRGAKTYVANCNQNAPAPPQPWLGLKAKVQTAADNIYGKGVGRNWVNECFNDLVDQSLAAGVNPIYTLSIWVQETAASNYATIGCKTQDFGINDDGARGFEAQLSKFLNLPYLYPKNHPDCFANGCSILTVSQLFQKGNCSNSTDTQYAIKTQQMEQTIAPNCDWPDYPTQMTSCH